MGHDALKRGLELRSLIAAVGVKLEKDVALFAFGFLPRVIAARIDAAPPFSALFTLWLSMIAAVGLTARPAFSRHFT